MTFVNHHSKPKVRPTDQESRGEYHTNRDIYPFCQYSDIFDFYLKTGMTPIEAHEFLLSELMRKN